MSCHMLDLPPAVFYIYLVPHGIFLRLRSTTIRLSRVTSGLWPGYYLLTYSLTASLHWNASARVDFPDIPSCISINANTLRYS